MTIRAPRNAEVLRRADGETGELRALRVSERGRVRLFLEVNASRLARLLGHDDDDGQLYRCSEYRSESELLTAFDRAAVAIGH